MSSKALVRFEASHMPVPESGCWLWMGFTNRGGYGRFRADGGAKVLAHRFAWQVRNGEVPVGLCVLHRCDTPACVNPDHLFLGTKGDNNADKTRKGRQSKGQHHAAVMRRVAAKGIHSGRGKLTDEEVAAIRTDPRNHSETARAYGVTHTCISQIRKGERRQ